MGADANLDQEIDVWVAARFKSGLKISRIERAPWIEELAQGLPQRLPASFRSLFERYRFPAFEVGAVRVFGNLGSRDPSELVVASARDKIMAEVTRRNGFLQIGRPLRGADPVCLELRRRTPAGECAVVQLDSDGILIHESTDVVRTVAPGLLELLRSDWQAAIR